MKTSIAISILILAAGAGLGWHDRQKIEGIRSTQKQLAAEIAKLGVSSDPADNSIRSTKRERATRPAATKLSPAEIIDLAREGHELVLYESLSALDPAGLKAVLMEIATTADLDEQTRMRLDRSCTTVLANKHPQAALKMFSDSPEIFTGWDRGRSMVVTALACLAKINLTASLDWLRNNPQSYPDIAKGEIISAVAEQDAQLAFRLITELDFKISDYAVRQILGSQKTLEGKSTALAGLRDYLPTIQDEKARDQLAISSMETLAWSLGQESFDSATRWMSEQNLTPQEYDPFVKRLNISTSNGETGRWIEWLRQSPPAPAANHRIESLIDQWTSSDYRAAMQWALTRSPGQDRAQVLKIIHGNWPKDDPAGKETFAKEHGIK